MHFTKIQLENVFAYYGSIELDLSGGGGSKNIFIVSGRNGMGKTSLLNAVKLLFLGVNDERLRKVGFPPHTLGQNQYVRGVPGLWSGLINTKAQREGTDRARVAITWQQDKQTIDAERAWRLNGPSYTETFDMYVDGQAIRREEAALRLADTLPRDFVPFFFFDGEQIQALAEAEESASARQIERILNISFVNELQHEVDEFVRSRKRDALSHDTQVSLKKAEGRLSTAGAERDAAGRRLMDVQDEIQELGSRKRQLESERDDIRGGVSEADRQLLEHRLQSIELQREELARTIAEELPVEAPFIVNLAITLDAFEEIDHLVSAKAANEIRVIELLCQELPSKLFHSAPFPDPNLTAGQIDYLSNKLKRLLQEYGHRDGTHHDAFPSLDLSSAQSLRDRFIVWAASGKSRRDQLAHKLRQMRRLTAQKEYTKEELAQASGASEGAIRRFKEVSAKLQEIENELQLKYENMGRFETELERCEEVIESSQKEIQELESQYEKQKIADQTVTFARKAADVLVAYRNRLREMRRESVETKINEKASILLSDHGQIKKINLNDQFIMTFVDTDGNPVGRSSISAGMRQLIATSLIWALKEESGLDLPVMIDTPLARIDKRNRHRLLSEYYPHAGDQVIVLPTDSEIADEQLMLLSPYLAREYKIVNPDGESAHFELLSDTAGAGNV